MKRCKVEFYLVYRGLVERYETWPFPLYEIAEEAETQHAAQVQHIERIAEVMEQRQRRLFT